MTRRVALLGKPLRRRHSQVMHDAAFAAAGLDARYELLEIEPDAVPGAVEVARGPDWLGLQVTAPYKRLVAGLCDEVEPDAAAIGAVNSVAKSASGALIGFNTDAPGFQSRIRQSSRSGSLLCPELLVAGLFQVRRPLRNSRLAKRSR